VAARAHHNPPGIRAGMPILLMMLFILLVFGMSTFWVVVAALAIYNGAIIGEAIRAGI
jgi:glutamate transport system permease protein